MTFVKSKGWESKALVSEIFKIIYIFKYCFLWTKNDTENFKEKESSNDIPALEWDVLFTSNIVIHTFSKNNLYLSQVLRLYKALSYRVKVNFQEMYTTDFSNFYHVYNWEDCKLIFIHYLWEWGGVRCRV